MIRPLSLHQQGRGLTEARRIIRDAVGHHFCGEVIPFAPEFTTLALQALEQTEAEARLWRAAREIRGAGLRHRLDIEAIEREVPLSETGAWR